MINQQIHSPMEEELFVSPEDSDSKLDSQKDKIVSKTKLIKKNSKKNVNKNQSSTRPISAKKSTQTSSTMAPFSLFESDHQKLRRLELYFKEDIENYYRKSVSSSEIGTLQKLVSENLVSLKDVYKNDMGEVWKQNEIFVQEILWYFNLIKKCRQCGQNYTLFHDIKGEKKYCCFRTEQTNIVYEINNLETQLLKNRQKFMNFLSENESLSPLSEISQQILFLFKNLYIFSTELKSQLSVIQSQVNQSSLEISVTAPVEEQYSSYLVCKLVLDAYHLKDIDFFNYFRNNERHELGYEEGTPITDPRQFEQYMKKKKNKKGKKGRHVLHTACMGCFSSSYQQYNPFNFCQECFMRFHKLCYTLKEDGICQQCHNKKANITQKVRAAQCDCCPMKGLLSLVYKKSKFGTENQIHIFCMLVNNMWKIQKGRVAFCKPEVERKQFKKCVICQNMGSYTFSCGNCAAQAHATCAYFAGWRFEGQISKNNKIETRVYCCGGSNNGEISQKRKFIINYKRYAYTYSSIS